VEQPVDDICSAAFAARRETGGRRASTGATSAIDVGGSAEGIMASGHVSHVHVPKP
jgi:hypothetical protein